MKKPPVDPKHVIQVTITNRVISLDRPDLKMGRTPNKWIQWKIVNSPGWKFPEERDGVVMKADPNRQFSNGHRGDDTESHYLLHNKNSDNITYFYTITVTDDVDPPLSFDPSIINQG